MCSSRLLSTADVELYNYTQRAQAQAGRAPSVTFILSTPFLPPMSTTTPSEIWNNILKDNVEKDDPLWKEYLDKAAVFDVRMVDEWNKIIDVLLVYVGFFLLSS